jgi:hypothetical protein
MIGSFVGPNAKLLRRLGKLMLIISMDEYGTTKTCSRCFNSGLDCGEINCNALSLDDKLASITVQPGQGLKDAILKEQLNLEFFEKWLLQAGGESILDQFIAKDQSAVNANKGADADMEEEEEDEDAYDIDNMSKVLAALKDHASIDDFLIPSSSLDDSSLTETDYTAMEGVQYAKDDEEFIDGDYKEHVDDGDDNDDTRGARSSQGRERGRKGLRSSRGSQYHGRSRSRKKSKRPRIDSGSSKAALPVNDPYVWDFRHWEPMGVC